MLIDALESLWLVDEAWGRTVSDVMRSILVTGAGGPGESGAIREPPLAAPSAEQLAFLYARGLEGEGLDLVAGPHTVAAGVQGAAGIPGQAQLGAVVVIPVFGLMQQHRSWLTEYGLGTSTDFTMRAIQAAIADPAIGGIVLRFHSGGGAVHGVKVLADYILKARKEKPIWGHADSAAASAAYWLLASCGRAIATPMADVGSVGCFMVHTSYLGADEKFGIKRTVIRAGKNKAEATDAEDLTPEAKGRLQARVDAAYEAFTTGVGKGRGISAEKVRAGFGQGALVAASDALEEGMLDAVQPFQDTLVAVLKEIKANARARSAAGGTRADEDLDVELLRARADLGILGKA